MGKRGGSKPGERRGGRQKGTPNKAVKALVERVSERGIDPFDILLSIAGNDWKALGYKKSTRSLVMPGMPKAVRVPIITLPMRQSAAFQACEYIYAKRKPIDAQGSDANTLDGNLTIEVKWADEDDQKAHAQNAAKDPAAKKDF